MNEYTFGNLLDALLAYPVTARKGVEFEGIWFRRDQGSEMMVVCLLLKVGNKQDDSRYTYAFTLEQLQRSKFGVMEHAAQFWQQAIKELRGPEIFSS